MKKSASSLVFAIALSLAGAASAAQLPIAISGYTQDMVVENTAANFSSAVTATMDGGTAKNGNTWMQVGLDPNQPTAGLPTGTTFVSQADPNTQFSLQPATGNNAILLDSGNTTATITLNTPARYSTLSILDSSGNGTSTIDYTLHFVGGTATATGTFSSPDWYFNSPVAYNAADRVSDNGAGGFSFDYRPTQGPWLYQENLPNTNGTLYLSSISLTWDAGSPNGSNSGIFALSGTAVPEPSTFVMLGVGAIGLLSAARRRRKA